MIDLKMEWKTEKRKLKDIHLLENNPRTISKENYERLGSDLKSVGNFKPIIIDKDGTILGGNQRYKKLIEENGENFEVEVSVPEKKLTENQRKKVIILDNKERGEDNIDILANEFEDILKELGGFEDLLPQIEPEVNEDDYEEPEQLPSKVQLGEVWQLGKHRLMCGDSTKIEDVEKLMNGQKADMVFTDPPYGVDYASKNEFLNNQDKGNRIQKDIVNDTMNLEQTQDFIYNSFLNLRVLLAEKSSYYITAPQGGDLLMMMMMMQKAEMPLRHMIIWVKNNHVLGRTDYNYKHEPILFGWINTHNFYGRGEHHFSTWEIPKPHKNDLHPTMKPIALIANAVLNSTLENEIVADIFGGSGSTLIACEQTNRVCYMMELDTHYCDVIIDRWQTLTNKTAVKVSQ